MRIKSNTRIVVTLVIIILLIGGVFGGIYYYKHKVIPPPRRHKIIHDGIDVSHHQKNLSWEVLGNDSNIEFAYVKATEGASWQDPNFKHNISEARKHGIKVGAYHFLTLNSSPEKQVENFCKMVDKKDIDLIPAIDIEEKLRKSKREELITQYATRVSKLLTERFGQKPLIYTSSRVYNEYLHPKFQYHYLWIASYTRHCPLLKGKTHVNIWQYSERGKIPGYNNPIDLNCFVYGMTVEKLELKQSK